ncbi:hypothetical protein Sjap_022035 [Stephania japonica]|uniref:Uncharacterized protein n=1 Tax=Stephania japonica TaxID=461633 RepID=A0AAP0HPI0_9MAGN
MRASHVGRPAPSAPLMSRHVDKTAVSYLQLVDLPRDAHPHELPDFRVEVKDEEYMSDYEESEGELEVSQSEPEIVMAQTYEEEAKKEIEVTLTRPEDLQQESKDDQSFILFNPPTLPYIFDDFDMEVDVKERSKTFRTADTFVLDDLIIIDSYVLEVPDKLPFLNKGIYVSLPNAKGDSIILGYSLLEGIT